MYGIQPDFMPMAKGLSSGYLPIAAAAIHERIFKVIHENAGMVHHGYTYSGHPAACAVALANIDVIEKEGLIARVREETAPYFRKTLQQVVEGHPIVGEMRGVGLLAGFQLVRDRATRDIFPPETEAAIRCREFATENNLIMRPLGRSTVVLSPPLIISRSEIDELADKVKRSLDSTAKLFGLM
jgi:putrescine aminotransferase